MKRKGMDPIPANLANVPFQEAPMGRPPSPGSHTKREVKYRDAVDNSSGVPTLVRVPIVDGDTQQALDQAAKPKAPSRRNGKRQEMLLADAAPTDIGVIPHAKTFAIPVQKPERGVDRHRYNHFASDVDVANLKADIAARRLTPSDAARYNIEAQEALLRRKSPSQAKAARLADGVKPSAEQWDAASAAERIRWMEHPGNARFWMSADQFRQWVELDQPPIKAR